MYGKKEGKIKAKMRIERICILSYREREIMEKRTACKI